METRNNQTVAFTGHRKERILQGFGNDPRILAQIREAVAGMVIELYGQGYKEYYTGMASGFDMTAAEAVLQVRERYEGIKLIAAVPFRKQPLWFEAEDRLLYARLLERMDRVVMVSENYHKGCYLRRDEYMVRKADTVIAYWDLVPKGGTFYTVSKALESGKPVINLYERMEKRSVKADRPSHFASCILYYLFLRTGREATLFPPFLLLRFLLLLLDLHFSHNLL